MTKTAYTKSTIEWTVRWFSPTHNTVKAASFYIESQARDLYAEKKTEGRKKLVLIRRTTTVEEVEEK